MIHATVTVSPPPSVSESTPKHIHVGGVAYGARMSSDYNDLQNKPSINGVTLEGNKTTEELHIQAGVTSWNGETGDVTYTAPVTSVNGQTGDVTISIPPVPVESVNGKTGAVVLDASDVGALPADTEFEITYDPLSSVDLALVDEAETAEPNYTPSGTVTATLNCEYKNNKLYIYGVNTTFTGNGVKLAVEEAE